MSYLILFFAIANLLVGLIVFIQARRGNVSLNVKFLIFSFIASIWTFSNFYLRLNTTTTILRFCYAIGLITATSTLVWIYFFLEGKLSKTIKFIIIPLSSVFFIVSIFTDYIIVSVKSIKLFGYEVEGGSFFPVYSIYFGIIVGIILFKLFTKLKKETDLIKKNQILYVFSGAIVLGVTSFMTSFLIPSIFKTYGFVVIDNISFFVFIASIGYSIARYKLFDLKIVATEILTFFIWIGVLINLILATTIREQIFSAALLVFLIFFGILLIKSIIKEVEQREKLEVLTQELKAANEKLIHLDKIRSEFLSFAAHQVKSPMTVVKGYAELILDGTIKPVSKKVKEIAQKLKNASSRMIVLVNNLLDSRRIEEGRMEYNFEKVNIVEVVKSLVDELEPLADEKKLEMIFESKEKEINVMADTQKFLQVIQNLIDNAVKYTSQGWIRIKVERENNDVLISVSDSGMGISKELASRMFQQFSRGEFKDKVIQGTGLGLYIAKQIVLAHQGDIWAESEGTGTGSKFLVKIPVPAGV